MNNEQRRIVDKIATVFSVGSGKPTLVALCEELVAAEENKQNEGRHCATCYAVLADGPQPEMTYYEAYIVSDEHLAISGLNKEWNRAMIKIKMLRDVLERIALVCTKNMDRDCNHRMAFGDVRQIVNDTLQKGEA